MCDINDGTHVVECFLGGLLFRHRFETCLLKRLHRGFALGWRFGHQLEDEVKLLSTLFGGFGELWIGFEGQYVIASIAPLFDPKTFPIDVTLHTCRVKRSGA